MIKKLSGLKAVLFDRRLDFRVRLFNILGLGGVSISFIMAGISLVQGGLPSVLLNAAAGVLAIVLLTYTNRSGRYQLCYTITIVLVFLILFPVMFFVSGGYHSSMPCFFIFAVLFTVFMLSTRQALLFAGIEILLYMGCYFIACWHPGSVIPLSGEDVFF